MERMRRLRARIGQHDSYRRWVDMGVDVFLGAGHFQDKHGFDIDGKAIRFKRAMIAAGPDLPVPISLGWKRQLILPMKRFSR